jgi:hypothetical protein
MVYPLLGNGLQVSLDSIHFWQKLKARDLIPDELPGRKAILCYNPIETIT